ncbi:hypothetical protein BS50DRAFT_85745 [Corynespora cassiicola Philippines]|uniref:BRCT domain-containing protein n=1 Tax=Corynespora cassiicola Philippines TaxID=1448308 RepID=A0A2T2NDY3_CORCC|nr:hypothetical protein BS50DRAFT_85745 [Corynespora cassiicola Philippines]
MGPKKQTAAPIPVRSDALAGTSIIITGEIEGQSRKAAEQILINAGAKIEKSLNKKVQLVVLGKDAGEKKLEKIEQLGVETRDWDDLIEEIKADGGADDAAETEDDEDDAPEEVEEKPKLQKGKSKAKANTKAKADPASKSKPSAVSGSSTVAGKTVIITGTIAGHDRKAAQEIVEKAGAKVAKSLNKSVELAILGTNAGPDKLAKIEEAEIETIAWNDLADELGIEIEPEKKVANVEAGDAPDSVDGMTLIITGTVEGQTRAGAQKLLESAGAKFAKSLNKSVELVVLGTNAGPDKLNKIAELGIETCSWEGLITSLGLEAEASEPPKKKSKKS